MKHSESVKIEGHEKEIPESAREAINDQIHDVLREDYGIDPDAVYWLEPVVMAKCDECGYTDVRSVGTDCPVCVGGTMEA